MQFQGELSNPRPDVYRSHTNVHLGEAAAKIGGSMPVLISEDMKTALSKPFQQQFIVNQL